MTSFCKNCNSNLKGKFCYNCGQKVITEKDKKLKSLFSEFLHFFTHLDNKFLRTLKNTLLHPGLVTKELSEGITVRHFKLTSLFLIGTLIYFLLPSNFIGYGYLNNPYEAQLQGGLFRTWKVEIAKNKIQKNNLDETSIAKNYDIKQNNFGKLVTIVFIPLTIPILLLLNIIIRLFKRNHQYTAYDLGIAALEINSIFVYGLFLIVGITTRLINLVLQSNSTLGIIGILLSSLILVNLFFFFKKVYKLNWWLSLFTLILFILGYIITIELYRLISFLVFI